MAWWDSNATTYRDAFVGPESVRPTIPVEPTHGRHLVVYDETERPLFVGHYWLTGNPEPLSPNIACTDYSVAREGENWWLIAGVAKGSSLSSFLGVPRRLMCRICVHRYLQVFSGSPLGSLVGKSDKKDGGKGVHPWAQLTAH